jgi:predicted AAA+ superfamily ATPase
MDLIERNITSKIEKYIETPDVIVIHGARQVGKTSIMKFIQDKLDSDSKQTYFVDLEDSRILEVFNEGPESVLKYLDERNARKKEGKLYFFIDEIQYLKDPSNFLKLMHDHYKTKIKLIVSGSSSFEIKTKFKDSLVGRTISFDVYPLSFSEYLVFTKCDIDATKHKFTKAANDELKKYYKEYVLYGGYPRIALERGIEEKELYLQQIIDTYIRKDIRDVAQISDISKFNKLLEILASQSGNMINVFELANTARLSRQTVEHYLFIMENTYIIKLLNPFSTNIRSELFKTPKIYFNDTGIAQLLWLKTFQKTMLGNMFENSVFSELIKNCEKNEIFYWRTQDKKEIDFIIRKGKEIMPVEVKLNESGINTTAIRYFIERYHLKKGICICFDKQKEITAEYNIFFPWEFL